MNPSKMITTYFRLNEQEREANYLTKSAKQVLKSGRFAVGVSHIAVLNDDGTVTAYGNNDRGQCNTSVWRGVIKVVAGDYHTAALKSDGTVVAVGDNSHGQCNVNDFTEITELFADKMMTVGITASGSIVVSKKASKAAEPGQPAYETEDGFQVVISENGARIVKYVGTDSIVHIPATLRSKPVYSIGSDAFRDNQFIRRVIFSDSVTEINANAFRNCSSLEIIGVRNGLKRIAHHAFYGCGLKAVILPDSLESIGEYAFADCRRLELGKLPKNLHYLSATAFAGCPDAVTSQLPGWKDNLSGR